MYLAELVVFLGFDRALAHVEEVPIFALVPADFGRAGHDSPAP